MGDTPYTLYGGTPPHENVDTSLEAAQEIEPHVSKLATRVKDFLGDRSGGATCDEVEVVLNMSHQTASARLRELVLRKQIVYAGQKRLTRSGRRARVYHVRDQAA